MAVFHKPTIKAVNAVRKRYALPKNASLSTAQYKEAVRISMRRKTDTTQFAFQYKLLYLSKKGAVIEVCGDHLSKNRVDSLPFKQKLRYKKAFKDGVRALCLVERKRLKSFPVMQKATIRFAFYSQYARDYDNHSETIKRVQDTVVSMGLLADDNPKVLKPAGRNFYIKSRNKRVVVVVRRV